MQILKRFYDVFGALRACFVLPPKHDNLTIQPLRRKDKVFLGAVVLLCIGLCVFQFCLGCPGYHIIGDTYNSIANAKKNWHPVFIAYVTEWLYAIFGKHLYYLFLCNLIPFYTGLCFVVCGLYIRFRSPIALLGIFPIFIGNIYFQNFIQYHSFALPMMLFCLYAMALFYFLTTSVLRYTRFWNRAFWTSFFILMFCAILWRHNAIFSVFPLWIVLSFVFLQNRGLKGKSFYKPLTILILTSAMLCLAIVIIVPKILTKGQSYPSNHLLLLQIAGACVPADDESCFLQEWYYGGKSFVDVKAAYAKDPRNADPFNVPWWDKQQVLFNPGQKLPHLTSQWLHAIAKYPLNFLQHELGFINAMWIQTPSWIFDAKRLQNKPSHPWHVSVTNSFPENERSITLTPLREQIYTFLFEHKILLNHIVGVLIGVILLVLSSILLIAKKRVNALLVFTFSAAFAAFGSALMIALFSPVPETRYMPPVLPVSLMALIGFVAFVWDWRAKPAH